MMEGEGINTTSAMIEDDQIAHVQSPPRAQASDISPLENVMDPSSQNSPTYVEDLPSDVDSEFEDEIIEGMEDYMEDDLVSESKIKALQKSIEELLDKKTLLQYEARCCQITNKRLGIKIACMRAINAAYLRRWEDQDAELRALIAYRQILERSLDNFPGTSRIPKNPRI